MARAVISPKEGNRRPIDLNAEILNLMRLRTGAPLSEWGAIAAEIESLTREKAAIQAQEAESGPPPRSGLPCGLRALCTLLVVLCLGSASGFSHPASSAWDGQLRAEVSIGLHRKACAKESGHELGPTG